MKQAIDSVDRSLLFSDLEQIIEPDELHIIKILLQDVCLQTRYGETLGDKFTTNKGVPQGDSLSPILFTLYLAKALEKERNEESLCFDEHNYAKNNEVSEKLLPTHIKDHNYSVKREQNFNIDQQYADDLGYINSSNERIEEIKRVKTAKLKKEI